MTLLRVIPLYTSSGQTGGFFKYPHIYDQDGYWIGWVASDMHVYSVLGHYVGWLNKDRRVLRRRTESRHHPVLTPPNAPLRLAPPALIPLPPLMAELGYDTIDVLEEMPDLLPTLGEYAYVDEA